jgi:hypothetical protein
MLEQDYKRMSTAREWARHMYERDMAWQVYTALRDGLREPLPIPSEAYLAGFYGYADA